MKPMALPSPASACVALLAAIAALPPRGAWAQRPLNLDFTLPSVSYPDRPWGWSLGWSAFAAGVPATFTIDRDVVYQRGATLRIVGRDTQPSPPLRSIALQLPAAFARGHTLTLRGALRGEGLHGSALVQLEAWGDRRVASADTATLGERSNERSWHPFTLEIEVPPDADIHSIYIAAGMVAQGSAWVGGLSLAMDGRPIAALPTATDPPTAAQRRWLATRTAPLRDVAPVATSRAIPEPDLAMIDRITADAHVVALGESTHGTREFFEVKHRIIAHLVRTRGFRLFAIEANQLAVEHLNQYVLGGPGTAREAMRVLFRVWNTEEMLALVEWARAFNDANPRAPLRFVGYDMQDHRTPIDSLNALAARVEPSWAERIRSLSADYRAHPAYVAPQLAESTRVAWQARADTLWREVSGRRQHWLAASTTASDSMAVEWGVQNANLFRQAAWLNVTLNSPDRDSLMAANLDWALRTLYPGVRAIVWAHDVHVSHGGDAARSFNAGAQMGAHLKHTYRHAYRALSLLTRAGSYSATRSFNDHQIIAARAWPAPEGSIEHLLASLPRPRSSVGLVVDLRVSEGDADGGWLWTPRLIRHVGYAAYDYAFDLRAAMPLEFDGAVFIDTTTPSRVY